LTRLLLEEDLTGTANIYLLTARFDI